MNIPDHLADRPLWRGLPTPFINRVGLEQREQDWSIRYDRTVRAVAAFQADEPGGPPDFTRQCIQRQRECVLRGWCQVCRRDVPWEDRRLAVGSMSVETVEVERRMVPVVTEPWLCPDCADFATAVCPALIRRRRDEDLHVVEVTSPGDVRIVLSHGWIEGRYEAATRANPVIMWAKILLLNVRIQSREDA